MQAKGLRLLFNSLEKYFSSHATTYMYIEYTSSEDELSANPALSPDFSQAEKKKKKTHKITVFWGEEIFEDWGLPEI